MTDMGPAIEDDSYVANADFTGKQGYAVALTANGGREVALVAAATAVVAGILLDEPAAAGRAAAVRVRGVALCVSDGSGTAIAPGDLVGPDATGKMVKKATADYAICGQALDASAANGTKIRVKLFGAPGYFRTAAG